MSGPGEFYWTPGRLSMQSVPASCGREAMAYRPSTSFIPYRPGGLPPTQRTARSAPEYAPVRRPMAELDALAVQGKNHLVLADDVAAAH